MDLRIKRHITFGLLVWSMVVVAMSALHSLTGLASIKYFAWAAVLSMMHYVVLVFADSRKLVSNSLDFLVSLHLSVLFLWLTISFALQYFNPDVGNIDMLVGDSFELLLWRNLFVFLLLAISLDFVCLVSMMIFRRKFDRLRLKQMLMSSRGVVLEWQNGAGTVKLERFGGFWLAAKPKRKWRISSSHPYAAGDHVKVVAVDDNLKNIQVAEQEANERSNQQAELENGFIIKWWHWLAYGIASITITLILPDSIASIGFVDHLLLFVFFSGFCAIIMSPMRWFFSQVFAGL